MYECLVECCFELVKIQNMVVSDVQALFLNLYIGSFWGELKVYDSIMFVKKQYMLTYICMWNNIAIVLQVN